MYEQAPDVTGGSVGGGIGLPLARRRGELAPRACAIWPMQAGQKPTGSSSVRCAKRGRPSLHRQASVGWPPPPPPPHVYGAAPVGRPWLCSHTRPFRRPLCVLSIAFCFGKITAAAKCAVPACRCVLRAACTSAPWQGHSGVPVEGGLTPACSRANPGRACSDARQGPLQQRIQVHHPHLCAAALPAQRPGGAGQEQALLRCTCAASDGSGAAMSSVALRCNPIAWGSALCPQQQAALQAVPAQALTAPAGSRPHAPGRAASLSPLRSCFRPPLRCACEEEAGMGMGMGRQALCCKLGGRQEATGSQQATAGLQEQAASRGQPRPWPATQLHNAAAPPQRQAEQHGVHAGGGRVGPHRHGRAVQEGAQVQVRLHLLGWGWGWGWGERGGGGTPRIALGAGCGGVQRTSAANAACGRPCTANEPKYAGVGNLQPGSTHSPGCRTARGWPAVLPRRCRPGC